MYNQEDLKALELFNRKAEILKNSSSIKFLIEQRAGITMSWERKDKHLRTETRWPDEEARDAFVLTFRFFIQKKEKASFRKMARIYDNLPISQQEKELFKDARKKLNDFLNSKSTIQNHSRALTRRYILNVFIYGELAHADEKKKEIFDHWMSSPLFNVLVYNEFVYILGYVTSIIAYVQNLNQEVIKELREKK